MRGLAVLREELENIKDSLDPEDYNRALRGINLGEQVALSNIDTEKFDEISAEAMRQVEAINGTIENLRLALQLTDRLCRNAANIRCYQDSHGFAV